jgi:hypothetical protein
MLSLVLSGAGRQRWWHLRGQLAGGRIDHCTLQATREAAVRWVREHHPELIAEAGIDAATATFGQALQLYRDLCSPSPDEQAHLDRLEGRLAALRLADVDRDVLTGTANELFGQESNAAKNRQVIEPAASVLHFAARNGLCRFVRVEKFPILADQPPAGGRWDEFR